jgi:hypothetical protein
VSDATTPLPTQPVFARRLITLQFQLGQGSFGDSGQYDTLTLSNVRATVQLENVVWPMGGSVAYVRVYGMTLAQMQQLSYAGLLFQGRNNVLTISAGDEVNGMANIFKGIITEAYPNFDDMPETFFYVFASTNNTLKMKPATPTTYPGGVPASQVFSDLCAKGGVGFQNYGVTATLRGPYLWGSVWQQIDATARAAGCFVHFDGRSQTLNAWLKGGAGNSAGMVTVSPATGMIGYPKFQLRTVIVSSIYSPYLASVNPSSQIRIQSQLQAASGTFVVNTVNYNLSSRLPKGPWEIDMLTSPATS